MPERTTSELQAVSKHVLYEAQMLFATATLLRLQARNDQRLPWALEMATIESFAMHTRVLIEFLWHEPQNGKKPRFSDDAFAADFLEPGRWAEVRQPMESQLAGLWSRAGNEIAHLSYKRTSSPPEERGWEFDLVAGSIGRAFRLFLQHVDGANLAQGFEATLRASWPDYLNHPVAVSFPPSAGALSAATSSLVDIGELRRVRDADLLG
jgi:hypothetical protein